MNKREVCGRIKSYMKENKIKQVEIAAKMGVGQSYISAMINGERDTLRLAEALSENYGVSLDWLIGGCGSNDSTETNDVKTNGNVAMKPHYLTLGQMGALLEEQGTDSEMLPVIPKLPKYDYTLEVRGDSMLPEYKSGDIVACLDVTKSSFIQWGRVHLLNTTQGVVMKVVYEEGENIRCVSRNEAYPDIIIPKAEVYSIGLVVGMLRIV